MSISYSQLPSAWSMRTSCDSAEEQWPILQASTLFAALTTAFAILFIMPMVVAAPVGMICGRTFWCGDLLAVQAWIQSALLCALSAAGALVIGATCLRIYMISTFGAPYDYAELQVDISHEETRKMCRAYLRAMAVDEIFSVDRSEKRQIALVNEGRFSRTFLEISTIALDNDRTWIVFRAVSKLNGAATLMSSFYNDFGCASDNVNRASKLFSPYASLKQRQAQGYKQGQAMPSVRMADLAPPPTMRRKQRYQHEVTESDMRHLKACG
ncbi:MAG: hypothetical protein JSS83_04040 [Cyanobacteria bacterium SZAS LIN-3]|nr:hypothetical protein [Cyanobacteria bacterium SZAS LIN-3]